MSPSHNRRNEAERRTRPMDPHHRQSLCQAVRDQQAEEEEELLASRPTTEWRIPTIGTTSSQLRKVPGDGLGRELWPGPGGRQLPAPNDTIELLTLPDDVVEVHGPVGDSPIAEVTNATIELLALPDDAVDVETAMPSEPTVRQATFDPLYPGAPVSPCAAEEDTREAAVSRPSAGAEPADGAAAPAATGGPDAATVHSTASSPLHSLVVQACLVGVAASAAGALLAYFVR